MLVTEKFCPAERKGGRGRERSRLAHYDDIMVLAVKSPATFIFCVELMILEPGDKHKLI